MKVALILLIAVAYVAAGKIDTRYDNIDLDSILDNKRLFDNYANCILNKGNCTPDGKLLKESIPDALKNHCSECSEKQRNGSEKVIRHMINKRPDIWEKMLKIYDPDNIYRAKYQDEAKKLGITV